jgi:hypothetical protein
MGSPPVSSLPIICKVEPIEHRVAVNEQTPIPEVRQRGSSYPRPIDEPSLVDVW